MAARAILAAGPITAVLASCGASHLVGQTAARLTAVQPAPISTIAARPTPALMTPVATPPPAPQHDIALLTPMQGTTMQLSIRSASGAVIAATTMQPTESWSATTGPGAAYWISDGAVHRLTADGNTSVVAQIPAAVSAIDISPDGSSFAYATSVQQGSSGTVLLNTIYVERFGGSPQIVAQRLSDPAHPSADAPGSWQYYLDAWTVSGIVFARAPVGGCGCGAFDMQSMSQYSGIVDPAHGNAVTDLTSDASCPLSAVAPQALISACVEGANGASTGLLVRENGATLQQLTLSGKNAAGDGMFSSDDTELAYATIPANSGGCGSPPPPASLHVLDLSSGSVVGGYVADGLTPSAWMPGGDIYATAVTGSVHSVLGIDPVTLRATSLWSGSGDAQVVGIV